MADAIRTALCLATVITTLSACATASPLLHAPAHRAAEDVSRDMADCEAASTPGVGTYAEAAGKGLLARIATPFVAIVTLLSSGFGAPPPPPPAGVPDQRGDQKGAVMLTAGIGAVAGIIAGPFVAAHYASETVRDARQERFTRCLTARGYGPPPGPRAPRVLVLVAVATARPSAVEAFRGELQRRGYVFGKTLDVELRWWDGPDAAGTDVLAQGWDAVVTDTGEIAVHAREALPETPIVMAAGELDPVASGLARSYERPQRTVTGLTMIAAGLDGERLDLLRRALPHLRRVAVLTSPDNASHARVVRTLARDTLDVRRVDLRSDIDLSTTMEALARDGVEALLALPDPALRRRRDEIAAAARRAHLPAIAGDIGFADGGGLLEYHPALDASWRQAAAFVDKVLKGAAPAWLPIETVAERDVVLNIRTAEALGLTLPSRVLLRATRVVR